MVCLRGDRIFSTCFVCVCVGGGGGGGGGQVSTSPSVNKSTASGAIYARSSVIFPHRMAFVRGRLMQ